MDLGLMMDEKAGDLKKTARCMHGGNIADSFESHGVHTGRDGLPSYNPCGEEDLMVQ